MFRVALSLCYCGANYSGWQKQNNIDTIEKYVEKAVSKIANHDIKIIASGRTDKGVHALNQVIHFDTNVQRSEYSWVMGVNSYLPKDIVVTSSQEVNLDFHARFSAIRRKYLYILSNDEIRPCILNGKIGWTFLPLDIGIIKQACNFLVGELDFSSFRSAYCQAKSPIRIMYKINVKKKKNLIFFDFEANGFLHNMIRNILGALIFVGSGKMSLYEFKKLINDKNRIKAPPTFMPDGLYLKKIIYPRKFNLKNTSNSEIIFFNVKYDL